MKHLKKFNESISGEIPTAEEFLKGNSENEPWTGTQEQAMIEFAKLHVDAALKRASENVKHELVAPWESDEGMVGDIDKDSILNSYPLENIK